MTILGQTYILRPARCEDAKHLKPRQCDIDEWAASIAGGVVHLPMCISISAECWTVATRAAPWEPHIIFGVVHEGDSTPVTWLIGTDLAERDGKWLLGEARDFLAKLFSRWPTTECWSDARNVVHHRWLRWLGYQEVRTMQMGPMNRPFIHYRKAP